MTGPLPWFKFHAHYLADWRIGGRGPAVLGAFVQALAALWSSEDCALPAEPDAFAMAARIDDRAAAEAVRELMAPHPERPALLTFPPLLMEWREAEERRDKCRGAGQRGAVRRWSGSAPMANAIANAMAPAMANATTNPMANPMANAIADATPQQPEMANAMAPAMANAMANAMAPAMANAWRVRVREREDKNSIDDARERAPAREERSTELPPLASRPTSDDEGKKKPTAEKPTATAPAKPAPPPVSLWDDDDDEEPEPTPPPAKPLNGSARMRAEEDARLDALLAASEAMPRLAPEPAKATPAPLPPVDIPPTAGTTSHAADARRIVESFAARHKIVEGDRDVARRVAAAEEAIAKHGLDRFEAAIAHWEGPGRTSDPQTWRALLMYPDSLAPTERCDRVEAALARMDKAAGRKTGKSTVGQVSKAFAAPERAEAI